MRRKLCSELTLWLAFGATTLHAPADEPDFDLKALNGPFKSRSFLKAAAALQQMGKEKAIAKLAMLTEDEDEHNRPVVMLCRMLFCKKANADFRAPRLGSPNWLGGTDFNDWPLLPLEIVDGVPFRVAYGYNLAGAAEGSRQYLRYCCENCDWSEAKYNPAVEDAVQRALNKLLASPKWKVKLEQSEREYLSAQLK
jgi:hypothetical protein